VQLDLELARTRTALAEARRQLSEAQVRLAAVIGIPLAALDGQLMQWEALEAPEPPSDSRVAQLREQALLSRPDLERAIGEYRSREIELQQQVRAQYPQVSLGPGYTYDHGIRKATLGVSLALPLFNRNQGPIAEAEMRREAAGSHLLSVQAQILSEVDGAAQAYRGALAALQLARQQSLSAQTLADASARSLAVGAEDQPTLLALRLNANAEQLAELDVLERAQQALGQLEDALRTPLAGNDLALRLPPDPMEH
jgi:cobalt-zinc-cadmium efflux system outer membrane protein